MLHILRRAALVALSLAQLALVPEFAAAQQAPYVTAECSQNIRAVGRPAVRHQTAVESAIASWDSEARRIHGARTGYSYRQGERMGRMRLECRRSAGRHACTTSGRACVYVASRTATASVPSACRWEYAWHDNGNPERPCVRVDNLKEGSGRGVQAPWFDVSPTCPTGYALDPADVRRCLRS